jgi:GH43 family beta-xylosidase
MLAVIVPALTVLAGVGPASAATWQPAIAHDFPDPTILQTNGAYYGYSTEVGLIDIPDATSSNGLQWSSSMGVAMPTLPSWASFGATWAPTVAKNAAGEYVMFYAATDRATGSQCIGEADSGSPTGPFIDGNNAPVICDPADGGDIDPDIFVDPSTGQNVLIWKLNGNAVGEPTSLWATTLSPNLTIAGTPSLLLIDDQSWQAGNIEGPAMVEENGTYYLFYSANDFDSPSYAIGYATCVSPFGPCTDSSNNPVIASDGSMMGPGGPSFYFGPSGLEMGFAAWDGTVGYGAGGYRALYTASVTFNHGVPRVDPLSQTHGDSSYWVFNANGDVHDFNAPTDGSAPAAPLAPVVGAAPTPDGGGYWTVAANGAVDAYGDAQNFGGMQGTPLNKAIVGMAATPDGGGYWLVASDGGVFSFGDAPYDGSMGAVTLNKPIVGMAADSASGGYWLVAADGGIFSFGAPFFGSTGNIRLNEPIVGMAVTPDGAGYWLVASDGGIFTFGDAAFYGSTGNIRLNKPVRGMAATPDGAGYWLVASDGGIFTFGDAAFSGSTGGDVNAAPTVAVLASPR